MVQAILRSYLRCHGSDRGLRNASHLRTWHAQNRSARKVGGRGRTDRPDQLQGNVQRRAGVCVIRLLFAGRASGSASPEMVHGGAVSGRASSGSRARLEIRSRSESWASASERELFCSRKMAAASPNGSSVPPRSGRQNSFMSATCFELEEIQGIRLLRLVSDDDTNRLTREVVIALTKAISELATVPAPLVIAGNQRFFSAGADLREIAALDAPSAYEFSKMGQALMSEIANFPAPVYAAISGYCMGGGLDLALACRSSHRFPACRVRASGRRTGTDYRLGRNTTFASPDWKSGSTADICRRRKTQRRRCAAFRTGGHNRGRSRC
jgi:hypothetical protein